MTTKAQVTDRSWNEAVERQFPWVSEQFTVDRLTSRIKISKVSTELLEVVPSEEYGTNASGYYTHDQVKFHKETGEVLGEVNPRIRHSDANDMSGDQDGESIGDRWYHLEYPTAVAFLTRKTYYSGGRLSHDPDSYDLEIFKVSDFDVRWWMFQRDKASDSAITSTGLGPDDTHDKIKLTELRHALDTVYRNFALEEILGLDRTVIASENPWCYISNAIYCFLEATIDNK
jgi:hypothetical protein